MVISKILTTYLILTFSLVSFCDAQNKTTMLANDQEVALLTSKELYKAKINDVLSIEDLFEPGDWSLFNRSLGVPEKIEEKHDFVGGYKIIEYEGAIFEYSSYTGTFELARMTLNHPKYWITIDGKKIRPGMKAGELQKLFPEAFQLNENNRLRFYITIVDQQGQQRYRDGKPLISDITSFAIELNETTQEVAEIILHIRII